MGNCRLFTIILLLLFLNNSWNSVWSQVVTRFLNEMDTDEFPNPDNTSCKEAGCRGAGGYKFCNDCCKCRCNYGSYVSMNKRCVYDEDIAKDCRFVLGDASYQHAVVQTSSQLLKVGQTILYCRTSWDVCKTMVKKCVISRNKTVYDNNGWKLLWSVASDVDIQLKTTNAASDSLIWKPSDCSIKRYDGVLVSLGISCQVEGFPRKVNSCLAFKVKGSYRIGIDPSTRTTCSATTTSKPTTMPKSETAITEPANVSSRIPPTTGHPSTVSYRTTIASTIENTTPATIIIKTVGTSTVFPSQATDFVKTATKPRNSHKNGTGSAAEERNDGSDAKSLVITAASLSSAGLLLVVFLAIAVFYVTKRRRHSENHAQRHEDPKGVQNPYFLPTSPVLPLEINRGYSNSFWTVNTNEDFVISERPPVFSVVAPNEDDNPEEGLYDQPISRRTSSLGKLYAVVNKRASHKGSDDGYSSIVDVPLPSEQKSSEKENDDEGARVQTEKTGSQPTRLTDEPFRTVQSDAQASDAIYDQPEAILRDLSGTDNNGENSGPIYMLYEPLHDRRNLEN